jgi:leucine dehydrogenase
MSLEDLLRAWDGEEVVVRRAEDLDAWIVLSIHSTRLGPAGGGTRLRVYPGFEDAVTDGLRLSQAMTVKFAAAGIGRGGGKAILAVPEVPPLGSERRRELMLRYGELVESLGGIYSTACDMNTVPEDMDVIGERTSHVYGRTEAAGGPGSSGPATGAGVFHGMRAAAARAFGTDDLTGRTVLVQGVGGVGGTLSELLAGAGAKLLVSDVDQARAAETADRLGAEAVPADRAIGAECEIFSPNAVGAILNAESIPRLRCRVVAGGANNQLATAEDADRLAAAGILYAPDFVMNAGGVLYLIGLEDLGWDEAELDARLRGIGDTISRIFDDAESEGITTDAAALALAHRRIEAGDPNA